MTRAGFAALTQHFARSIAAPPLLTDLGVDFLRRTLASVLAILIVGGSFLTRAFFKRYVDLHAMWDDVGYRRAVEADTLLLIALPMLIVGLLAIVVSPLLFPDEIDYRTLAHLPISRFQIFAAKFVAVGVVAIAVILAVNIVTSLWLPIAIGGDVRGQSSWTVHTLPARIAAHAAASLTGSFWAFAAVMALQGLCLAVVPPVWRRQVAVLLQGTVFVGLLASLPYVFRIPALDVSSDRVWHAPFVWIPPVWFLGIDRWLLDPSAAGYGYVARIAASSSAALATIIATTYARLYRRAETLAFETAAPRAPVAPRRTWPHPSHLSHPSHLPPATRAILSFTMSGLRRSRLHQFVFLLIVGVGFALLVGQLSTFFEGGSFLGYRPRYRLHAVIAAPLLLGLSAALALRAVFLLPLDQQAVWMFRLTETPELRPRSLDAVTRLLTFTAVVPSLVLALIIQPGPLGYTCIPAALLTTLANLLLVEVILRDWSRIPFTCTYLPGKRVLAYTLGVLLGAYFVFVYVGANLIRWGLAEPLRATMLGGVLLGALIALRRRRWRSWGTQPLEFEDEDPLAIRTLNLLPDERH
jgi:hypothetical protein